MPEDLDVDGGLGLGDGLWFHIEICPPADSDYADAWSDGEDRLCYRVMAGMKLLPWNLNA